MFESFIAKRIRFDKDTEKKGTAPAVRIATIGIALGIAVMILSVAIVVGFKKEVSEKVVGFGSHIQISNFDSNASYEPKPIALSQAMIDSLQAISNVQHVALFGTKPGILKTDTDFQGIVIKGVGTDYPWEFFAANLVEGELLRLDTTQISNEVLISQYLSNKMQLGLGDKFLVYFVNEEVKARRFTVKGIYKTDFSEYDELFIIADLQHIRRINAWENDMANGVEIRLYNFDQLNETADLIYDQYGYAQDRQGNTYYIRTIKDLHPMIFSWLDLLDMNVVIILLLMLLVAGFTMISGLLIIILERANMIGILKAMGANNPSIRSIFLRIAFSIVLKGLFWGNAIALSLCFLQLHFKFLQLNPETYYLSTVPIHLNWLSLIALNLSTLVVAMLMLLVPSYIVAKIVPVKTIRFE